MDKLLSDLSTLTTIPIKTLTSLFDKVEYCIVDNVKENYLQNTWKKIHQLMKK